MVTESGGQLIIYNNIIIINIKYNITIYSLGHI